MCFDVRPIYRQVEAGKRRCEAGRSLIAGVGTGITELIQPRHFVEVTEVGAG
jgi:hypothetical protein